MEAITAAVEIPYRDFTLAPETPIRLIGDLLTWKHCARANVLPPGFPRAQVRQPGYRALVAAHASKVAVANAVALHPAPKPAPRRSRRTGEHDIVINGSKARG